jgi:crossover junction endodeoxyribonuclease RusA
MEITFDVIGRPSPQGSKKSIGNNRFIESSKYLPAWRTAVKLAAEDAVNTNSWARVSGPVELEVMFYLDRPSSVSTVKRPQPTVPPDLDKLIRGVGDALTGVVYDDDSQVIRCLAWKVYADTRPPGAFIRVAELSQFDNSAFQSLDFLELPD